MYPIYKNISLLVVYFLASCQNYTDLATVDATPTLAPAAIEIPEKFVAESGPFLTPLELGVDKVDCPSSFKRGGREVLWVRTVTTDETTAIIELPQQDFHSISSNDVDSSKVAPVLTNVPNMGCFTALTVGEQTFVWVEVLGGRW